MHSLCLELDLYNFPVRQINNGSASWTIFRCTTSKVFGLDVKSRDVTAESVASTTDISFDLLLGSASNYSWQCFAAYLRVLRAAGKLRNLVEKWSDWIEFQIGSAMTIKLCGNALVEVNEAISLFESDFLVSLSKAHIEIQSHESRPMSLFRKTILWRSPQQQHLCI